MLFVRDLALLEGNPARVLNRVGQVSNELRLLGSRGIPGLLLWPPCLLLLHLSALCSHLRSPLPQSLPLQAPSLLLASQSCLLWLHRLLLSLASHVLTLSSLLLDGLLLDCVGRHLNHSIIRKGKETYSEGLFGLILTGQVDLLVLLTLALLLLGCLRVRPLSGIGPLRHLRPLL